MGNIELTKRDCSKVAILSWEDFEKNLKDLNEQTIIEGIAQLYSSKRCDAQQVFGLLHAHPRGFQIWDQMHYRGNIAEDYLPACLKKSFEENHVNNHDILSLYQCFLNPIDRRFAVE